MENEFKVVQSDFPTFLHPVSVNFQNYSCKIGIELAESLKITHVLRVRADMYCNNIQRLVEIYENIFVDGKMIFIMHFHNNPVGYLIDYAHFGDTQKSKQYCCCFQLPNDYRFEEQFRQECCYGTSDLKIIKNSVIYSGKLLMDEKIDFHFLKFEHKDEDKELIKSYNNGNNSWGFDSFD